MILSGKTCIVTGASGGLGGHLAARFWQEGASLLLTGRNAEALQALAASLPRAPDSGQKLLTLCGDLTEQAVALELVARAKKEFPVLTVLVNNAAVQGPIGPIWQNDFQEWEAAISLNLLAPAKLCALILPWMLSQSYGKIINLSGGGGASGRVALAHTPQPRRAWFV